MNSCPVTLVDVKVRGTGIIVCVAMNSFVTASSGGSSTPSFRDISGSFVPSFHQIKSIPNFLECVSEGSTKILQRWRRYYIDVHEAALRRVRILLASRLLRDSLLSTMLSLGYADSASLSQRVVDYLII